MTRLPEKGDVAAAVKVFNARVSALAEGGGEVITGAIAIGVNSGSIAGDTSPLLAAYEDLFDVGELLTEAGLGFVMETIAKIALGRSVDVNSELISMYMQAAALGVLIERGRWQS